MTNLEAGELQFGPERGDSLECLMENGEQFVQSCRSVKKETLSGNEIVLDVAINPRKSLLHLLAIW